MPNDQSTADLFPHLELWWEVHLAEQEYPEDEEADDADAHDEVEVGPGRLVLGLAHGELGVVSSLASPPLVAVHGDGSGRRGRAQGVVRDHSDARHLHLQYCKKGEAFKKCFTSVLASDFTVLQSILSFLCYGYIKQCVAAVHFCLRRSKALL